MVKPAGGVTERQKTEDRRNGGKTVLETRTLASNFDQWCTFVGVQCSTLESQINH